jgi:cytochrome c551/c552
MKHRSIKKIIVVSLLTGTGLLAACGGGSSSANSGAEAAPANTAETIFRSKCALCHEFKSDKIGPALEGAPARWQDPAKLASFIRNSQAVIKSGDPYAAALYEKWHHSQMPAFPELSDADIQALIEYLK